MKEMRALKFIKAVYAGNLMALAMLSYIFAGGGFVGSLASSFCIFVAVILSLPLYIGRVSRILSKQETILSLIIIAAGNVMGLLVVLMLILPAPWYNELKLMTMQQIINLREHTSLLSHLTLGIIAGGIMEVAYAAYRRFKHPFCLMLVATVMMLVKAEHNMMDLFCYMIVDVWHPWMWLATVVGNTIGALTLSVVNFDKFGHFKDQDDYDFEGQN